MKLQLLSSVALLSLITACAVGPEFVKPAVPDVKGYTEGAPLDKTAASDNAAGAAQLLVQGKTVAADWWTMFGSEPLNALMKQALAANPDVQAAKASLRQAQEAMLAMRGELLPAVDANFSPTRKLNNPAAFGQAGAPSSVFNLYNASVSVSYAIDVFGATRREVEVLQAQVDVQRYELEAAYLALTSNVVNAAIQEASLREQIKETKNIIAIQREQAALLEKQFTLGAIPKTSLLEQQALVAQTETTLPPLEKQLAQKRNQLAILAGKLPAEGVAQMFDFASLHLPEELPVSLPSDLVQQRPDLRAAEAQLHAATAEVGVAIAAMLPRFTIGGSYGVTSMQIHSLFTPDALVWNLGGNLVQPLFHGGELLHAKRGKEAAFDKAKAQYQSTLLQAFQNVADVLHALQYDADALASQVKAEKAAADSFGLSRTQYEAGAITYSQMLDTQRTWQQTRIGLVQAQAARLADSVALFQSLGGGWWNRDAKPEQPASAVVAAPVPASQEISPAPTAAPQVQLIPPAATSVPELKPFIALPPVNPTPPQSLMKEEKKP